MRYIYFLSLFLLFPSIIENLMNLFSLLYFWQIKEYRWDKVYAHIRYTINENNRTYLGYFAKILFLFFLIFTYSTRSNLFYFVALIIFAVQFFKFIINLQKIITRKFTRPKISIRNIIISGICGLITLLPLFLVVKNYQPFASKLSRVISTKDVYEYKIEPKTLSLTKSDEYENVIPLHAYIIFYAQALSLVFVLITPISVSLCVGATVPLSRIKRTITILKAKKLLADFPKLKTIAITGSYGKTTTKEALIKILEKKYKVASTDKNLNTRIGIAQSLLKNLDKGVKIFIAEMGAYKKGEIKKACQLLPPNISIVTNVGKAHIDTFGSIENTKFAKYEIVSSLKNKGIAILNADNRYTQEMATMTTHQVVFFSMQEDLEPEANPDTLIAKNIEWNDYKVKFEIYFRNEHETIETTIIGDHLLQNILAAIACSLQLKLSLSEIKQILKEELFESSHFKIFEDKENNVLIINDSYNTNPLGFDSALKHLSNSKIKEKIVITKGIPEIGKEIVHIYYTLAKTIIESSTQLITTDRNLYNAVINTESKYNAVYVEDNDQLNKLAKRIAKKNTAILIEGRINETTLNILLKNNAN